MADARSFFYWLLWLAPVAAAIPAAKELLHFLQLSSYQLSGFVLTLRRQWKSVFTRAVAGVGIVCIGVCCRQGCRWMGYTNAVLAARRRCPWAGLYDGARGLLACQGTPLAVTGRVRRLVAALALVMLAAALLLRRWAPVMGLSALLPALLPLWVAVAAMIAWPFEKLVSYLFIRDAVRILDAQLGLIRIGVTGSYGKTSVKFILKTLLSEKYPVLATRQSFNTPMGVTRCIREDMRPEHRVFIAEMGARHRRDIRDLTRFVRPEIGILTAVGPQHLETLGDIDRVAETKFDLIRALPPDGFAVFYNDGICRRLYDRTAVPKAIVGLPGMTFGRGPGADQCRQRVPPCMKDGGHSRETALLSGAQHPATSCWRRRCTWAREAQLKAASHGCARWHRASRLRRCPTGALSSTTRSTATRRAARGADDAGGLPWPPDRRHGFYRVGQARGHLSFRVWAAHRPVC